MLRRASAIVSIRAVLLETERPELLLGRDIYGASFLCLLVRVNVGGHSFLAVRVSDGRLARVRRGEVTLREAFDSPEEPVHFYGTIPPDGEWDSIKFNSVERVLGRWLPADGLRLTDFVNEPSSEEVVAEAVQQGAPVVVCRMNPPESLWTSVRINADRLVAGLGEFQSFVREAANAVMRRASGQQRILHGDDPGLLYVTGLSFGSVSIHLSAADRSVNLIETSPVCDALAKVDALMQLADRPLEEIFKGLRRNRGQVLTAYRGLLEFVAESDTAFEYRWAEPSMHRARGAIVTPVAARRMAAILDAEETLQSDPFELTGQFWSVNTATVPYTWAILDQADGRLRRGYVLNDAEDVLDGVTIKTQTYRLAGEERLVRPTKSGKRSRKRFLASITAVRF